MLSGIAGARFTRSVTCLILVGAGTVASVYGTEPPKSPAATEQPAELTGVAKIRRDAESLKALAKSELARRFLAASADLPSVAERTIFRDKETKRFISEKAAGELSESARSGLEPRTIDETSYYHTKYGSPLAYVRALDVLAENGFDDIGGKRILDYGYGTVGHLRLLASLGAEAVGVDVDSYLTALYCEPSDQGTVKGRHGKDGRVVLVDGSFPGDAAVRKAVGSGFDLFVSKNTLKNGYIHPAEPVDPRRLVQLGVHETAYVKAVFDILKPGGLALIYNICPAPAKPGQPYIPWADGRCPFPKEMWVAAGFQVIAFDREDSEAVRAMGHALGWDQGEGAMDLTNDLFCHYTLAQKPAGSAGGAP